MRVLVTRPGVDGETLLTRLTKKGHDGLHEPLLLVSFKDGPDIETSGVQAFLATSSNGVRALVNRNPDKNVPIYAVGNATALTAREQGFVQVHSAEGDVDALTALVTEVLNPKNGALYHATGSVHAGVLKEALEKLGFQCQRDVLYESMPAKTFSTETIAAIKNGRIDAVLLYSPRTAETFVNLIRKARLVRAAKRLTLICLSPAVAAKASNISWQEIRVAKIPTQDALLEMLPDKLEKEYQPTETEIYEPKDKLTDNSLAGMPSLHRQKTHTARTVFLTLLFSAIIIGAGAATSDLWLPKLRGVIPFPQLSNSKTDQLNDLASRLLELESKSNESLPRLEELQTQRNLLKLQLEGTLGRIESLEGSLDSVKKMIAAVDATNGPASAEATLKKLSQRLNRLEENGGSIASENQKRLGALAQQVAKIETKIPTTSKTDRGAEAQAFLLAVGQLRTAVRTGQSFSAELEILNNLKLGKIVLAETTDSLSQTAQTGVSSLSKLRQEFSSLAGVIVQAESLPKGHGLMDRTLARLGKSLKWRRTDNFDGEGVEAIVARADRALAQSNLVDAVSELKKLRADPASKVGPWLKNAEALISVNKVLNQMQIKAVALLANNE